MIYRLPIDAFLAAAASGPLLDVRAPAEFEAGHMPGAVSFPIFTDEERKRIGTLYKQAGHDRAVIEGLHFLGPRMAEVVKKANKLFPGKKVRMHCWRGGLRSGTMAWLLDLGGFEVTLLDNGYKSWRNYVLQTFAQPWQFVILGGMTGSGKTDLLKQLHNAGEQVIDLEGLAHHKGSSFGGIDQPAQPTQEQFENILAAQLLQLDRKKRIWVEDENNTIGRLVVPKTLYAQMKSAPVVLAEVAREQRVKKLAREYCQTNPGLLRQAVQRIQKRLGGLATKQALEAIETNQMEQMVNIVLHYYDKAYTFLLNERGPEQMVKVELDLGDFESAVPELMKAAENVSKQWLPNPVRA